ncbi:hypothetical protein [Microbacterium sediminis]|uniref:Uncharacterized protein n=1 Tax=Microbacterium sediminis TaxID=904291 RepID=A0A1B9NGB8_9MICO|nr:hypothetical protein [Microbacterium sediminis]OCG75594.1 hypothetical protein A7J15_00600 [Microbacterium sediminis]QBR73991.1 hypothetical protein E3O41_05855 [Microbacterium sediminis]
MNAPSADLVLEEARAIEPLREVSALLESVWGRTPEGAPMHSDTMRSLVHAGGLVTAVRDERGVLLGAGVLVRDVPGVAYGLIAAAAPGHTDRGIGYTIKQHQRTWCLDRDIREIRWTFDPLMSRNARFNLVKLGAVAVAYTPSFYGEMIDAINRGDDSDRLVASWILDAAPRDPIEPDLDAPALGDVPIDDAHGTWIGVPRDIDALRERDRDAAVAWRRQVRAQMLPLFEAGARATHFSRSGHYLLKASA